MKRKIFLNMLYIAFISIIFTAAMFTIVTYSRNMNQVKNNIQTEAKYLAESLDQTPNQDLSLYRSISSSRITEINADGTVLYDSEEEAKKMENHGARPEVKQALRAGYGENTRISDTFNTQTYYYGIKLQNGKVIRLSLQTHTIYHQFMSLMPIIFLMLGFVFFFAFFLSRVLTDRIVEPINEIDLEHPEEREYYDELSPLLVRIHRQNLDIASKVKQIKQKQVEFTAITSNMSEGFLVLNQNLVVLSYNPSVLNILGVTKEECENQNVLAINRSKCLQRAIKSAVELNPTEEIMKLHGRRYLIIANPVLDENEMKGIVILLVDVTEKEKRESLRQEFSANVSHELKTPLTTISGYAELMEAGIVKPEDIPGFAGKIHGESKRLLSMIEDIIKISKLDEAGLEMERESIDLYSLALQIQESLMLKAESQGVKVQVIGSSTKVSGIRQILQDMLYNLIENGIKYNNPKGQVVVTVSVMQDLPTVIIEDDGIGIPAQDQERIFERFYRVDKSHSSERPGTGLGLSIVKHAAKLHQARVDLESAVGKGTKITITFQEK